MTIPEVRRELMKLVAELMQYPYTRPFADRLRKLEKELYRRRGNPVTRIRSRAYTPELKRQLRDYKRAHPHLSMQQIANRFKTNSGRVTDATLGRRK
jgi:hypothetical protein